MFAGRSSTLNFSYLSAPALPGRALFLAMTPAALTNSEMITERSAALKIARRMDMRADMLGMVTAF
jgi:hypothetical protein